MLTWTIGSGGLIGSAVQQRSENTFRGQQIPWADSVESQSILLQDLDRFIESARNESWALVWAAGSGTTATPSEEFAKEIELNSWFWELLQRRHPKGPGSAVLISSAGSIHAGSPQPPFTAATEPVPISAYGRAKLAQEQAGRATLAGHIPFVICRVSNAYGPGQNLQKLQGLVSRLALATYTHTPLHLFVPLGTIRDYISTNDVAEFIHLWATYASRTQDLQTQVAIVASGVGTSIAQLVRVAGQVSHQRIPITMGTHTSSSLQPHDSRFIPTEVPGAPFQHKTNLVVGVKTVFDDIQRRLALGTAVD